MNAAAPRAARDLPDRLALIVVTDAALARPRGVVETVRLAVHAGAPAVQLRDKHASTREMAELARLLLQETRPAGALLFINDRVDVALAAGADGAHLGDDDLPLQAARSIVPPGFLLGRSVDCAAEASAAALAGADYVGIGPVFRTHTKSDAGSPIGPEGVRAAATAVRIPVVGIGGIDSANAAAVHRAGAAGVAVVHAVMRAESPAKVVQLILSTRSAPLP